jgi:dTMP kinase
MLIVVEGPDMSGKSTIAKKLYEKMVGLYGEDKVILTREPGGSETGEAIRGVLAAGLDMGDKCELLLFEAARAEFVRKVLKPHLEEDKIVITDRFFHSTIAYQGFGRELGCEMINELNLYALDDIGKYKNVTLINMLTLEEADTRSDRNKDEDVGGFDKAGREIKERIFDGYGVMAHDISVLHQGYKSDNVHRINAALPPNDHFNQVVDILRPYVDVWSSERGLPGI